MYDTNPSIHAFDTVTGEWQCWGKMPKEFFYGRATLLAPNVAYLHSTAGAMMASIDQSLVYPHYNVHRWAYSTPHRLVVRDGTDPGTPPPGEGPPAPGVNMNDADLDESSSDMEVDRDDEISSMVDSDDSDMDGGGKVIQEGAPEGAVFSDPM
ncbi:hypothetical protein KIPB_008583 [Kipferlia bialata]|uniref:Uncharacterized protein n=1 Tax=Kipferlia bialata TaxID=797122 RepID=A0A9K3GLK5_9EUKA|nr:hypothetical protein KIPB_008583 [Kipferlia bialata]|eukprot:g8583.t1